MAVVAEVICQLRDAGLPIDEDEINDERAFLAASSLLLVSFKCLASAAASFR